MLATRRPMYLRQSTMGVLLVTFQCFAGCSASVGAPDDHGSSETPWPTKAWQTSTPEEQGLDSASLARLVENVGAYKQDSLMIIRHGKIVAEAYYAQNLLDMTSGIDWKEEAYTPDETLMRMYASPDRTEFAGAFFDWPELIVRESWPGCPGPPRLSSFCIEQGRRGRPRQARPWRRSRFNQTENL